MLPIWNGTQKTWKPFDAWKTGGSLIWYQAYNASKHARQEQFKQANMQTLLDAVTGLLVLLSSQFRGEDFSGGPDALIAEGYDYYDMEPAIGSLFRIKFPDDWPEAEKYEFNWSDLSKQPDRFEKIDYNNI
jgi:hypothetical protein